MDASDMEGQAEREAFETALNESVAGLGLAVSEPQRLRLYGHYRHVVRVNRQFNLTRITSPEDAAVKHYADSLTLLTAPWADPSCRIELLDVGTGAGFPAVPLAIMCDAWAVIAIDGTAKKARFVTEAAAALGLSNVKALHARAGDLARGKPRRFDLVVLRAVSRLGAGLEEVHSLLRGGGAVVFYKTANMKEGELAEGTRVAARLGLREADSFDVTLPSPDGPLHRRLIRYVRAR